MIDQTMYAAVMRPSQAIPTTAVIHGIQRFNVMPEGIHADRDARILVEVENHIITATGLSKTSASG
jgi:hypothetical protein